MCCLAQPTSVTVRTPRRAIADAGKEEGDAKNLEDFILENPLVMVEFYGMPRRLSDQTPGRRRGIAQPLLQPGWSLTRCR